MLGSRIFGYGICSCSLASDDCLLKCMKQPETRVRMTLALGYWGLGDICIYWIVLLLGIFFLCDTQYNIDQTAVGTIHMPVNDYLVPFVIVL